MDHCDRMLRRASRWLLALACLGFASLWAQEPTGEINGTVRDAAKRQPLIGANVLLAFTNRGAAADVDGKFSIKKVPPGKYTLTVRYVGYRQGTQEITVTAGGAATADFLLTATALEMDEVIITGQGVATEKRRLPTAVETLSAREIELTPVKSVDQLLQGRIPGLVSALPTGLPGTGARMQTRGIKSVTLNSTPVIYVDGVRVDNNDNFRLAFGTGGQVSSSLADLVVGEIDRVETIKGGASSTLYGSEAANGVIQIFTKKGVPGEARWRFNVTSGSDMPENKFTYNPYTKDNFYRSSLYQGYGINVSGGSEAFSYNVSGKMYNTDGIVAQDKASDKQWNLSTGMRAILSDKADAEISATYTRSQFGRIFNDNSLLAPLSALEIESNFIDVKNSGGNQDSLLNLFLLPDLREVANRFISSVNVNYSPYARLKNKFTIGVDYRKSEGRHFASIESEPIVLTVGGFLRDSHRELLTITMAYTGSLTLPKLGPFAQTVSVGAQGFRVEDREINASGTTFRLPGTTDFGNASVITADESNRELFNGGIFVTDQIGLWDRLFMDLGIRFDGNSTFGKDVGIQTYPKAGLAYNISDESFYPAFLKGYLNSMKLRAAWGQTGNFPTPFVRDRSYASAAFLNEAALVFNNPGDQTLKPEKTTSIDFGFDAGLFDDRIGFEFTYFLQTTKDGLFNVLTDPASGFGAQQRNVGEIENKGIEATIRANVLNLNNFELNTRVSFATLHNEVTDLGDSPPFSIAGFAFAPQRVEEGRSVGVFRVNKPLPEADGSFTGRVDPNFFTDSVIPKRTGSMSLDATIFKKLTLTGLAEFAYGHVVLNQTLSRQVVNSQAGNIRYPEAYAKIPGALNPTTNRKPYDRNTASAVLIQKGDWFKIREVSLRYQLPAIGVRGLSLTASARNLAILGTDTYYADPELNFIRAGGALEVGGIVGANPSAPRQFRLGIDVTL